VAALIPAVVLAREERKAGRRAAALSAAEAEGASGQEASPAAIAAA
jgi:hypothetical protein